MRRPRALALLAFSSFAAVATAASGAHAQPEDRRAAAQALFEQGKSLIEAGRFAEACPKLADSQRLDPGIGTSLWLADCYENAGKTASAWAQFKEAAASAAMAKDPRESVARARAENLEKKLSRLLIELGDEASAPQVTVRRDGLEVGRSQIGNALPVDPGEHEVTASAPGHKLWKTTVNVPADASTSKVIVPALQPEPEEADAAPPAFEPAPDRRPPESTGSAQRVLGIVVGAVGFASAGVGTFFAFDAKSTYDRSNEDGRCIDNRCTAEGKGLRSDAESKATVATIAIGAGAALVVAGAVLFFTAPRARTVGFDARSLVVRF